MRRNKAIVFNQPLYLGKGPSRWDRLRQGQSKHGISSTSRLRRSACSLSAHVCLRLCTPALLEATKYLTHWRIGNPLRICTLFNLSPLLFIEYIYGAERVAQRVAWFDSASPHPWGGGHPNSAPWVLKGACVTQRCVPLFIIERNTLVKCQRGVFCNWSGKVLVKKKTPLLYTEWCLEIYLTCYLSLQAVIL